MYLFKQDRSPFWYTEFQIKGKKIRLSTREANKNTAVKVARELKKEYSRNLAENKTFDKKHFTYGDALIKWVESSAPESMHSHIRNTRPYLEQVPLTDVVSAAHDMKAAMRKKGLAVPTVNRRLACVKRVLNLAFEEWEWIDAPLGQKIKMFSEKGTEREVYLKQPEFQEFLNAIEHDEVKRFVCIAAHTGLRRSELYNLQQSCWQEPYIILPAKTKSKKPRTVPVIEELHGLMNLPWECSLTQIRYWFEKARKKMQIEHVRLHDMRHCFGSWLATNPEVALTTIRDLMGHSSLAVTSKYAHLRGQHFEAVSRALSPPTNPPTSRVTH